MIGEISNLIKKEITLEWRNQYTVGGILIYLICTIFVCYLGFNMKQPGAATWNALWWIILLFTSVNAIVKSFLSEKKERNLYYYYIANPRSIILSKIIYNTMLMLLLSAFGFIIYTLILGNPVEDINLFLLNTLLGSIGFASVMTMVAAIASKTNNSTTLMSIMSFPILIPMLIIVMKVSKNAIDGLARSVSMDELLILVSLNMMSIILSYILFPYLWRT